MLYPGPADAFRWTRKVKGVGSGIWRMLVTLDAIEEKAGAIKQQFLRGIGVARMLAVG